MRLIDGDVIDKKICDAYDTWTEDTAEHVVARNLLKSMRKFLLELPTIGIEPKRGEWIDEADKYDASFGIHNYKCSNCNSYADKYIGGHEWYTADKPNFCPSCGADMRKGVDDE